ncbi:MAG TPA: GntR family transcriptional regulator [Mycobacteriales bacterium]|nr:GntR family transcriptional regulator [Mycobacteriales bacterium]
MIVGPPGSAAPIGAQHQSLDDVVRDEILHRIMSGALAPGARLIESSIADELGVSRGPVRAAIRQLEIEGFVVLAPRRGASVATITATEALECYEIRTVLEGLAARLATERRTEADIERLQTILSDGDALLAKKRWDQLSQLNAEFHAALAIASGNSELLALMRQFSTRITWMFARSAQQRGGQAWHEHAEIVDAIVRRDSALASRLAQEHIRASREQFVIRTPVAAGAAKPIPAVLPQRGD